jgi:3',5'-cyclic-AMP phosphodiesterase
LEWNMEVSMTKQSIKILQLTDFHLFGDKEKKIVGMNPNTSLEKVFAIVKKDIAKQKPDLVVISGDLSQDNSVESYEIAKEKCSIFECPIAVIMGNHDNPSGLQKVFSTHCEKIFDFSTWRILFLNSHWPGHVAGILDQQEITFLNQELEKNKEKPTMIVLHHHVVPVASLWLDSLALKNVDAFFETINKFQNVKIVLCGHVHQESAIKYNEADFITSPSTSLQFAGNSANFRLDSVMPGYRWIELFDDGTYKTNVVRIADDRQFIPDLDSKGY